MRVKVLVVEDEATQRESIADLLRSWGYETETASDGAQALEKIRSSEPALMISDLYMRPVGGLQLLKDLQRELRAISCIVISGEATLAEELQAIRLGAFSFIAKPIYPELLRAEVKHCLEASTTCMNQPNPRRNN